MRTYPQMSVAVDAITEYRFPEEIEDACDLDNEMWTCAPGATDPFDPTKRLEEHITASNMAADPTLTKTTTRSATYFMQVAPLPESPLSMPPSLSELPKKQR